MKKINKVLQTEGFRPCRFKKFFTEQRCRYHKIFFKCNEDSVHGDIIEYKHPYNTAECHCLQILLFAEPHPKRFFYFRMRLMYMFFFHEYLVSFAV